MPDVVTTDTGSAVHNIPDYVTPGSGESIQPMHPMSDLQSGFVKMLDAHGSLRQRGLYIRDTSLTSYLSDMVSWATQEDGAHSSREVLPAITLLRSTLRDEELSALRDFFKSSATLWDDLLFTIDDQQSVDKDKLSQHERAEVILPWAQFNQRLATAFFHTSHLDVRDPERRKMESLVSFTSALRQLHMSHGITDYNELISGAQAQAAMMNTLNRLGCFIVVPDYDDEEEMRATDLKGVDFAAVTPDGRMLLIDSKGRMQDVDGGSLEVPIVEKRHSTQPDAVTRVMGYLEMVPAEVRSKYSGIPLLLERGIPTTESYKMTFPIDRRILGMGDTTQGYRESTDREVAQKLSISYSTEHEIDI